MKHRISKPTARKALLSLTVVLIAILSYTAALDLLLKAAYVGEFDNRASEYFNETLKRAAFTYAITRGINGVVSVIQETEVAFSPAGVGVTLAVGEILDPINDLIERFSLVMLISTASLGIQKILLEMGIWFGFRLLLTFSMFILLTGIWFRNLRRIDLISLGYRLIVVALVIRFCIPAVAVASSVIYDTFLKEKYIESTRSLEDIKAEIKDPNLLDSKRETTEGDPGFWTNLKKIYKNTKESMDIRRKLDLLKDKVSNSVKHIVNLIVVFLLQTVIVPLLVLWALIKLAGNFLSSNVATVLERKLKDITGMAK
jgi:hypothetical protein